jgi:hypothetical protein
MIDALQGRSTSIYIRAKVGSLLLLLFERFYSTSHPWARLCVWGGEVSLSWWAG